MILYKLNLVGSQINHRWICLKDADNVNILSETTYYFENTNVMFFRSMQFGILFRQQMCIKCDFTRSIIIKFRFCIRYCVNIMFLFCFMQCAYKVKNIIKIYMLLLQISKSQKWKEILFHLYALSMCCCVFVSRGVSQSRSRYSTFAVPYQLLAIFRTNFNEISVGL